MKDYYKTLGLRNSASNEELKRSYRILARRYHPDINNNKGTEEKFREIQEAYQTLADPEKRKLYDITAEAFERSKFNQRLKGYANAYKGTNAQQQQTSTTQTQTARKSPKPAKTTPTLSAWENITDDLGKLKDGAAKFGSIVSTEAQKYYKPISRLFRKNPGIKLSIIEVSVTVEESLRGAKKTVEIIEPEGSRKVSVTIPRGVRDGSVLRLRNKANTKEDLVIVFRLASHPFLSIKPKGLIMEVPITLEEALYGAQIKVPGLNDAILVKVPEASQSGAELRVSEQGIPGKEGRRGDLFVRFLVMVPPEPNAATLKDKITELGAFYGGDIRAGMPQSLL